MRMLNCRKNYGQCKSNVSFGWLIICHLWHAKCIETTNQKEVGPLENNVDYKSKDMKNTDLVSEWTSYKNMYVDSPLKSMKDIW